MCSPERPTKKIRLVVLAPFSRPILIVLTVPPSLRFIIFASRFPSLTLRDIYLYGFRKTVSSFYGLFFLLTRIAQKRISLPSMAFLISNILFRFYVSQSIFTIFLKYLETWRYFWLFKTLLYVCQNF